MFFALKHRNQSINLFEMYDTYRRNAVFCVHRNRKHFRFDILIKMFYILLESESIWKRYAANFNYYDEQRHHVDGIAADDVNFN